MIFSNKFGYAATLNDQARKQDIIQWDNSVARPKRDRAQDSASTYFPKSDRFVYLDVWLTVPLRLTIGSIPQSHSLLSILNISENYNLKSY